MTPTWLFASKSSIYEPKDLPEVPAIPSFPTCLADIQFSSSLTWYLSYRLRWFEKATFFMASRNVWFLQIIWIGVNELVFWQEFLLVIKESTIIHLPPSHFILTTIPTPIPLTNLPPLPTTPLLTLPLPLPLIIPLIILLPIHPTHLPPLLNLTSHPAQSNPQFLPLQLPYFYQQSPLMFSAQLVVIFSSIQFV